MFLLGIDGGQTSTKVCICDLHKGHIIIEKGAPIDHMYTPSGKETARKGIQNALGSLLKRIGSDVTIESAVLSISGVRAEHESLLREWLSEYVQFRSFLFTGDAKANLAGASAGKNDGIVVIAGGGSIAYFEHGSKEYVSGGYGHILGDEGSAYRIGLNALQAAIRSGDGRGPATLLYDRLLAAFGAASYWDIKRAIHADQIGRGDIADLAVIVDESAAQGDIVARNILLEAGEALGTLAVSLIRQMLNDGISSARKIYPTGGVFRNRRWVTPQFTKTVHAAFPDFLIDQPAFSPLAGTLIMAAETLGIHLQRSILSTMEEQT